MSNEEIVDEWVRLSDYDLDTSEAMLNAKRYLYVAFTCQQAIEKIIKGYYFKIKAETPPFIHNLLVLMDKSELAGLLSKEQRILIDIVDKYYISTRYPSYKEAMAKSLTPEGCKEMLNKTKELVLWIKEKLYST